MRSEAPTYWAEFVVHGVGAVTYRDATDVGIVLARHRAADGSRH